MSFVTANDFEPSLIFVGHPGSAPDVLHSKGRQKHCTHKN
jgi:hypothetical protein